MCSNFIIAFDILNATSLLMMMLIHRIDDNDETSSDMRTFWTDGNTPSRRPEDGMYSAKRKTEPQLGYAYCNAPIKEKLYTTADPEIRQNNVNRPVLIVRALYAEL
jgi:hypothetical protein